MEIGLIAIKCITDSCRMSRRLPVEFKKCGKTTRVIKWVFKEMFHYGSGLVKDK